MNWKKFGIITMALVVVIFSVVAIINFTSKSYVERQLESWQREIANRGNGSSLIYDGLVTDKDHVRLKRLIYQDGATGGRVALFNLDVDAGTKSVDNLKADRLEWVNARGNLLTLNGLYIQDIRENDHANHPWNEYLFSRFQGEQFSLTGNAPSDDPVELRAEQVALENLTDEELGRLQMKQVTILYTPEINATLDEFSAQNLEYGKIDEMIASINEGYIPIAPLSEMASADLSIEGLQLELDGEIVGANNTPEAETRLLQLFLDYAPPELRGILGDDARDLQSKIQKLEERDPEELAIDALEMMLQFLQNDQETR